ncbi:MAG: phage protein GemA/Gp16 family protein [Fibrobacterota bacterium]
MSASRTIHAQLARLGMADADYRVMLWDRYRASSSKDLTKAQAADLVASLHSLLPEADRAANPAPVAMAGARRRYERLGDRDGMATPKQLRMLEAAFVQRSRGDALGDKQEAFRQFLRTHFSIDRPEWIERDQVGRILHAVTNIDKAARPRRARSTQPKTTGA